MDTGGTEDDLRGRCPVKRIGIIGGLGPESTIDYYKGNHQCFPAARSWSGKRALNMKLEKPGLMA